LHLLGVNCHEKVSVFLVEKNAVCGCTEVGDHKLGVIDGVVKISIASVVNANNSCALTVRENLNDGVFTLMLSDKRGFTQVVD
jgi:hypothetical protein